MKFGLYVFFLCNSLCACFKSTAQIFNYELDKPDAVLVLPDTLREISGITLLDSTSLACVQDENGILFVYDIARNKIKKQYTFYADGDYEEITRVGSTLYILRSDGTLFEISDYTSKKFKVKTYVTGIPANNNEGLCYDSTNNKLLIACKGKIGMDIQLANKRFIYAFDLKTKKLLKQPAFEFDLQSVNKFVSDNKIQLRVFTKKNGQKNTQIIQFRTSAICLHPFTQELYLLSATDHLLFVFSAQGNIQHIEMLDTHLFNKAEGITFLKNGDMLISNEGQRKKPTLLRFNYRNRSNK